MKKNLRKIKIKIYTIASIVIFLIVIFLGISTCLQQVTSQKQNQDVISTAFLSEDVLKYKSEVEKAVDKYKLKPKEKYVAIILAQMQQESGGKGIDVMQCSEALYGSIGKIQTPAISIDYAVSLWGKLSIHAQEIQYKADIDTILQSYNFGEGYMDWLKAHSYSRRTAQNAEEYSVAKSAGLSYQYVAVNSNKEARYGDYLYVEKIQKYIDINYGGSYRLPYEQGVKYTITTQYREIDSVHLKPHAGIDLAANFANAKIYSVCNGKIIKYGESSDGFGISAVIEVIPGKLYIRYGHLNSVNPNLKINSMISSGTWLGIEGSTGQSTGSHLHLEFRTDNYYSLENTLDPNKYIKL